MDNTIVAGAGNDYVYTGFGSDFLGGDVGDNYLDGGPDDDLADGGAGNDTCRNINNVSPTGETHGCETIFWDQCGEFDNCRRGPYGARFNP